MAQAFLSDLVDIEIHLFIQYCTGWSGHSWQLAVFCTHSTNFENTKKLKIQFFLSTNSTSNSGLNHFQRSYITLGGPTRCMTSLSYFSRHPEVRWKWFNPEFDVEFVQPIASHGLTSLYLFWSNLSFCLWRVYPPSFGQQSYLHPAQGEMNRQLDTSPLTPHNTLGYLRLRVLTLKPFVRVSTIRRA